MIRIYKARRRLEVIKGESVVFSCGINLGFQPEGPKRAEGDGKTPEGRYRVCTVNRQSKFHISLGLSYPNAADAHCAAREKRIGWLCFIKLLLADALRLRPAWNTPLGGFVMIHGASPEGKTGDWTQGCAALSNADIETLAGLVKKGEPVEILP